jgi:AAA15 family ATPase/GTPase
MNYAEVDNVTWFYQLKERGGAEQIVSFIINEFPFIEGIEVLAPAGINGLYAIMADGTRRRVSTVSSGIYKIISILLAAAHTHNGIIVIDEIENGIFYEKYPAVWRILYKFAKDTGNQIFVSSHSAECLGKLPDVIGQNTDDFCQLRTMRDNGSCTVSHINGVAMKAALSGENEVRGVTVGIHDNS